MEKTVIHLSQEHQLCWMAQSFGPCYTVFRCWNTDCALCYKLRALNYHHISLLIWFMHWIHWQAVSHNFLFNHSVPFQKAIKWPNPKLLVVQRLNGIYCTLLELVLSESTQELREWWDCVVIVCVYVCVCVCVCLCVLRAALGSPVWPFFDSSCGLVYMKVVKVQVCVCMCALWK